MNRKQQLIAEWFGHLSSDIFKLCQAMNFRPTNQQAELLHAVQAATENNGNRYIACKSGQGPGKTACSVMVGLWRAIRRVDGLTVVTAPTMRQCQDVWVSEFRRWHGKADKCLRELIEVHKTKVEIAGRPDWGVRCIPSSSSECTQGIHAEHLTIIAEEASGIPRELVQQWEGTLTNHDRLFLKVGNPNSRDCDFFDCFYKFGDLWHKITFNAEETPSWVVSPDRNKRLEEAYGRDSDVYRIRVLGEFPLTDPDCVISSDDVIAAMDESRFNAMVKFITKTGGSPRLVKQFGTDFARKGGDESVIYQRQGNAIVEREFLHNEEPAVVAAKSFQMQNEYNWSNRECVYSVDASGIGQGVLGNYYGKGKRVFEFHNGGSAHNSDEYYDKITEGFFYMRDLLKAGHVYIPYDEKVVTQLSNRRYFFRKDGRMVVESKDEFKKRGYDSPDRGEATIYAFYDYASGGVRIA